MRKRIISFRSSLALVALGLGALAGVGCNSLTEPHDLRVVKDSPATKPSPQTNAPGATGDQGATKAAAAERAPAADKPAPDATPKRGDKTDRVKRPAALPAVANQPPSGGSCGD